MPNEPEFAEHEYWHAKRKADELRHAKAVSDEILKLIGIKPNHSFPGLAEAELEVRHALEVWHSRGRR